VRRIDCSRLRGWLGSKNIDRKNLDPLRETLKCFVIVSQQGPDFFASTFGVSIQSGRSYRTVQRHIDRLCELKVLKLKHEANSLVGNSVRRPATYVLHEEAGNLLSPAETYEEWKRRHGRSAVRRFGPQRVTRPVQGEASAPAEPLKAAPEERPHRSGARPQPKLSKTECAKFIADMATLMKGHTRHVESMGGMAFDLDPGDPRYRPKMNRSEALEATCKLWKRTQESVNDALKFWGFQIEGDS
jgi:hypothetical protein